MHYNTLLLHKGLDSLSVLLDCASLIKLVPIVDIVWVVNLLIFTCFTIFFFPIVQHFVLLTVIMNTKIMIMLCITLGKRYIFHFLSVSWLK